MLYTSLGNVSSSGYSTVRTEFVILEYNTSAILLPYIIMLLSAKNNNVSRIVIQETTVAIVDLKGKTALSNALHEILSIIPVVSIEGFTSDISVIPATHHMFAQLVLSNIGNMLLFNIYTDALFTTLSIYYGISCPYNIF